MNCMYLWNTHGSNWTYIKNDAPLFKQKIYKIIEAYVFFLLIWKIQVYHAYWYMHVYNLDIPIGYI